MDEAWQALRAAGVLAIGKTPSRPCCVRVFGRSGQEGAGARAFRLLEVGAARSFSGAPTERERNGDGWPVI
jgi:hypothetical protein